MREGPRTPPQGVGYKGKGLPWAKQSETLPPSGCCESSQAAASFSGTCLRQDELARDRPSEHTQAFPEILFPKTILFTFREIHSHGAKPVRFQVVASRVNVDSTGRLSRCLHQDCKPVPAVSPACRCVCSGCSCTHTRAHTHTSTYHKSGLIEQQPGPKAKFCNSQEVVNDPE